MDSGHSVRLMMLKVNRKGKKMRQDAAWTSQRWDGCIGEAKVTGFPKASHLSRTYRTSGQIHSLFIVLMSSNGARKKSCTLLFGFELRQA